MINLGFFWKHLMVSCCNIYALRYLYIYTPVGLSSTFPLRYFQISGLDVKIAAFFLYSGWHQKSHLPHLPGYTSFYLKSSIIIVGSSDFVQIDADLKWPKFHESPDALNAWGNLGKDCEYGWVFWNSSMARSAQIKEAWNFQQECRMHAPNNLYWHSPVKKDDVISAGQKCQCLNRPQVVPGNLSVVHDVYLRSRQGCGDVNLSIKDDWCCSSTRINERNIKKAMTQLWSNSTDSTCPVFMLQTNVHMNDFCSGRIV